MSDGRRRSRGASRNVQAFEALLALDSGDEAQQPGLARRRRSSGSRSGGRARPIQLRDQSGLADGAQPGSHGGSSLRQLQDMFDGALPPDIVEDIFLACDGSAEAAMEALLAVAGSGSTSQQPEAAAPASRLAETAAAAQGGATSESRAGTAGDLFEGCA